jgi:hypothetical protein
VERAEVHLASLGPSGIFRAGINPRLGSHHDSQLDSAGIAANIDSSHVLIFTETAWPRLFRVIFTALAFTQPDTFAISGFAFLRFLRFAIINS